jgi:hypothetical protein
MADLKLMNEVFNAWLTNFRSDGIPIGNNREVTAALTGKNPMQFAFVPPDHPAINASGELQPLQFVLVDRLLRGGRRRRRCGRGDLLGPRIGEARGERGPLVGGL